MNNGIDSQKSDGSEPKRAAKVTRWSRFLEASRQLCVGQLLMVVSFLFLNTSFAS